MPNQRPVTLVVDQQSVSFCSEAAGVEILFALPMTSMPGVAQTQQWHIIFGKKKKHPQTNPCEKGQQRTEGRRRTQKKIARRTGLRASKSPIDTLALRNGASVTIVQAMRR